MSSSSPGSYSLIVAALLALSPDVALAQAAASRTLVAVLAHADDESPAAPMLARYAREGVKIHLVIASDGGQGTGFAAARGDTIRGGEELVRIRTEEARCAARALGIEPPLLLSFPDGKLGVYLGDRTLAYRLTQRIAEELERLRPDVILTWGPEGGTGHPDHRMMSAIVMQLQRAGAPGVPARIFFMHMPAEGMRVMRPDRGPPPLLVPEARYVTVRVTYRPEDLQASARSMACHSSQFTAEMVERVHKASDGFWNGAIPLIPAFPTGPLTDLFP